MIKNITTSSRYLNVQGGSSPSTYISPGSLSAGSLRYNPNNSAVEVYDGNSWKEMGMSYASVNLSSEAESLLDWARQRRNEEMEYERLASTNQAVKIAIENVEKAKQQLTITAKLAKDTYHDHGEVMEQASP